MKTCPVCHRTSQDDYSFCTYDGSTLRTSDPQDVQLHFKWDVGKQFETRPLDDQEPSVMLYCPACLGSYPLTFRECPTHSAQLLEIKAMPRFEPASNLHIDSIAGANVLKRQSEEASEYLSQTLIESSCEDEPAGCVNSEPENADGSLAPENLLLAEDGVLVPRSDDRVAKLSLRVFAVSLAVLLGLFFGYGIPLLYWSTQTNNAARGQIDNQASNTEDQPESPEAISQQRQPEPPPEKTENSESAPPEDKQKTSGNSPGDLSHRKPPNAKPRHTIIIKPFGTKITRATGYRRSRIPVKTTIISRGTQPVYLMGIEIKPISPKGRYDPKIYPLKPKRLFPNQPFQLNEVISISNYREADWKGGIEISVYFSPTLNGRLLKGDTLTVSFKSDAGKNVQANNKTGKKTDQRKPPLAGKQKKPALKGSRRSGPAGRD